MGTERIIMEWDINKVTSAKLYLNTLAWEYEIIVVNFIERGIVYFNQVIPKWRKNLELSYERWFDAVPTDFKMFFLKYCKEMWNILKNGEKNVKTKKIEWLSVTYFSPSEIIDWKKSDKLSDFSYILEKYKNFNPISY